MFHFLSDRRLIVVRNMTSSLEYHSATCTSLTRVRYATDCFIGISSRAENMAQVAGKQQEELPW